MQLERDLIELVRQAGVLTLGLWPGGISKTPLEISTKPDGSQVTNADRLSNELILHGLARLCPGERVISEEGPQQVDGAADEPFWYIDPLDGTSSFIQGRDDFGVFVARVVLQRIDFCCMFFPARNQCAWAMKGRGAHLNGKQLHVSTREKLGSRSVNLRNITCPPNDHVQTPWIDAGAAFLRLCRGELDGVAIRVGGHQAWDVAAPILLVEEAGGTVTDERSQQIVFAGPKVVNPFIVASNGRTHAEVLAIVQSSQC